MLLRYLFVLFLLGPLAGRTQSLPVRPIDRYQALPAAGHYRVVLEMPYAQSSIVRVSGDTAQLQEAVTVRVEIVRTDFPASASLNALNAARLQSVLARYPFLRRLPLLSVEVLRQLEGAEKEPAQGLFHGVVLHFRPRQSPATVKRDLEQLDEFLREPPARTDSSAKPPLATGDPGIPWVLESGFGTIVPGSERRFVRRHYPADTIMVLTPEAAVRGGYGTERQYKERARRYGPFDSVTVAHRVTARVFRAPELAESFDPVPPPDSTLFQVFGRNRWRDVPVVTDATGSMSPYTAQLLLWLRQHPIDSFTRRFLFFNDGDATADERKVTGRTGGIYTCHCDSFGAVRDLLRATMQKGNGGDSPENDIEALLEAQRRFPEAPFLVLVADNWSSVKDLSLAAGLNKPVRIVPCGVLGDRVHPDYLELARRTGGSVHLASADVTGLSALQEGDAVRIGALRYKVIKGRLIEERP